MSASRPKNEEELQKREATGVIRASRFVRRYAQSHKEINVETICAIHREIFNEAWPEIAGVYREEELSITDSELLLPHPTEVPDLMKELDALLKTALSELEGCEGHILNFHIEVNDEGLLCVERLIKTTAWIHHAITAIHPFREGNGRTARLVGNLVLERYGLVGISVKIEKENKNGYRNALAQIDKHQDYEPLEAIISDGIIDRYHGVAVKYYNA